MLIFLPSCPSCKSDNVQLYWKQYYQDPDCNVQLYWKQYYQDPDWHRKPILTCLDCAEIFGDEERGCLKEQSSGGNGFE